MKNRENALKNIERRATTIFLNPVTEEEIRKTINNMPTKKSTGEDGIPMLLIKNNQNIFVPILTNVMNNCFKEGVYPETLKTSLITPVYKKGENHHIENYI